MFSLAVVKVQAPAMGSTDRITRSVPFDETATHTPFAYATCCQALFSAPVTAVQVTPLSLLRITSSSPEAATTTHTPLPYATDFHPEFAAMDRELAGLTGLQFAPLSLLRITRLVPVEETASHTPFP